MTTSGTLEIRLAAPRGARWWQLITKEEYESAVAEEGMTFEWKKLFARPEAVRQKGEEFWRPCHETQPYALLVAQNR